MPRSIALCLEDLAGEGSARYLQCVARVGRAPGLGLDSGGTVVWEQRPLLELWVSADDRLILFRPDPLSDGRATLRRGGRSLEVPAGKPVVLVDQDELEVGARRLRVHVHGTTETVHGPRPFAPQEPGRGAGRTVRAAAAAIALGAAVASGGCSKQVEVRDHPPAMPVQHRPDAAVKPKPDMPVTPIEVRDRPPEMAPTPQEEPAPQPKKK